MVDLKQPLPRYLTNKPNIIRHVVFTAAFALVFINLYAPFGVETWYNVTRLEFLFYSSLVILTGVLVVVVSRVILFYVSRKNQITVFQYILWVLAEVFFMALFYTMYEKLILTDLRPLELVLKNSVQNTALVLMLPYSVLWLYFSYNEKKMQIQELTAPGRATQELSSQMVGFHDEKDVLQLSVKVGDLLYLEASSNYVTIVYLKKDRTARFLLRNTMKKLEPLLSGKGIVRCHRSFMVNFDKVKLMRKDKNGLLLEMDASDSIEVPVSKTYIDSIMVIFSRYAN
ncbi:MAG: LytTR family transcriptional regulator [Bacteroidetes bacterium HGW-Bacteroidetes-22]|nr:MAG: LytTR family transcriptional regulator [Bacteroidetes bacterium HGW-Bacteroidetes-22]